MATYLLRLGFTQRFRAAPLIALLAAAFTVFASEAHAQRATPADSALLQAMQWRNIGPFRGGRSVAVAGVPTQPYTYYMGATGGGVWKTEDAGEIWTNISDGFFGTGSVGAVAVAESDPNVVYVGMGEHAVRGVTTSHGDGVYKSTDAGKTWEHLGLEDTRHISRVQIHPQNPDVVYVAAQGALHGDSEARGIYKSTDGGETWDKVFYVDETTGASDLAMDMTNPRILYAAMWDHRRLPWQVRSGGPGSGIYKSTDAGESWTELTSGLPELMGKIGVSVSRADPERVYAIIEADEGGLYRSDDAGKGWKRINDDRILQTRSWYYMEVYADPQDSETVYVLNAPFLRSHDGGESFEQIDSPHGDHHDLWINPLNNEYLINANDGGANVSLNGTESWSTQQNQPTAQFYRVNVDDRFPYYVYGGQQDNSSVAIASRTNDAGIDWKDWYPVAGCESAYLAFDRSNPRYVYGGCYQGQIEEYDHETRETRNIMAYPYQGLGSQPRDVKYRFNWNAPILVSDHDPNVIYHAGNVVLRSRDRGLTWEEISPDLTRDEEEKQGPGGVPITNEGAGGEIYNTIMYLAESPHEAGTLWAGSDDGLVHITRDGGASWQNVTPREVGEALVNSIEVSSHDPGTAYLSVTRYKFDDFTPHIFKTTDYGRSWRRLVRGIADDAWTRVVREDPIRRDLLYAGTEIGAYVSFDGGGNWQSLQLNLPVVPITDLMVKGDELVAATQGRAFWILTDIAPLRQMNAEVARADAHLFAPSPAIRMGVGSSGDRTVGENPPGGAIIYYTLGDEANEPITLRILDAAGQPIRTFSSAEATDTIPSPSGNYVPAKIPAKKGLNRFVWDLRHEPILPVEDVFILGGLQGRRVVPGDYQVELTANGGAQRQPLVVVPDPRFGAPAEQYVRQAELLATVDATVEEMLRSVGQMRTLRDQVEMLTTMAAERGEADPLHEAGQKLVVDMNTWEELLVQPRQETFQDVINFPNKLATEFLYLKEVLDTAEPLVTEGAYTRLQDLLAEWQRQRAEMEQLEADLTGWNALFRERGLPALTAPGN